MGKARHLRPPLEPTGVARPWMAVGAVALAAAVVGTAALAALGWDDDRRGEVVRVIDGDTLLALVDGEETTIRLLNVDTPETKDPDQPVQCLGPEATAFLTERLPAGTEIELEYDKERLDRYDRTLAGVFESGSLINAEIARAGLGVPVLFAPNDRFLAEVEEASKEAQKSGGGLFSDSIECTLPAQLLAQTAAVDAIPATVEGDPADALAGATTVVEGADAFLLGLTAEGLPGLGNAVMAGELLESYLGELREDSGELRERATTARSTLEGLKTAYDEEQERLEQERLEQEEQERQEREEREEQEREERERQEQRERERQKSAPAPAPSGTSSGSSGSSSSTRSGSSGGSSSGGSSSGGSSSGGSSSGGSSSGGKSSGGSSGGKSSGGSSGGSSSGGKSSGGPSGGSSGGGSSSSCVPYGPEIPHSDAGGYTGKRYGMPGGKTFRKCS